ncbi:hypothetical protein [Sphingobacterium multivorum]|uniref:hypothetical protein n=1 Tax=Sphingobacterium multivorum TaxID=28454 RepID=UPI0028AC08E5|nr:hypothetical protein [Sphingobacterium multivorum]
MNIKSFRALEQKFNDLVSKFIFKSSTVGETVYEYTSNEVGTEVYVSTSTGSELAPNGKVELPNGDSFIVTDGKISEVLTVANEETEEELKAEDEEEKGDAEESKEEEAIDLIIDGVEEEKDKEDLANEEPTNDSKEVDELKAEIEALKATIKELKGEFSKEIDTKIEEFKAVLKNTPASFSKQNTVAEDVKEDKFLQMARMNKTSK